MTSRLLTCPACGDAMRVVQRGPVSIDRCAGCKGVFLDNGELEKLITLMTAAEDDNDWLQVPPPRAPQPAPPQPQYRPDSYRHEGDYYRDAYKYGHKYKKKSAMKTFMDIFD